MEACNCENLTLGNTGVGCDYVMGDTVALHFVSTFDGDGNLNKISTSAAFDKTFWDTQTNHIDPKKRLYPLQGIKNVEDVRGEPTLETFTDGTAQFMEQGVRGFKCIIPKGGTTLLRKLAKYGCTDISVFMTDSKGNFIGKRIDAGYIYPVRIDENTYYALLQKEVVGTSLQNIMINFQFEKNEQDEDLIYVPKTSIVYPTNLLRGLLDVTATFSGISQTGVTITLVTDYLNSAVEGLVISDFYSSVGGTASRLYNVTDAAAVTISTFAESSPGVYDLTFTSQTITDDMRAVPVKNGYDFSTVHVQVFEIV